MSSSTADSTEAGEQFTVTRSEQISGRLDVAAVKQSLGDSWRRFEVATVSTVIRIKAVQRFASALSAGASDCFGAWQCRAPPLHPKFKEPPSCPNRKHVLSPRITVGSFQTQQITTPAIFDPHPDTMPDRYVVHCLRHLPGAEFPDGAPVLVEKHGKIAPGDLVVDILQTRARADRETSGNSKAHRITPASYVSFPWREHP